MEFEIASTDSISMSLLTLNFDVRNSWLSDWRLQNISVVIMC